MDFRFQISKLPDFGVLRFPDFQTLPAPPDKLSDPNLTPLPTHPGIKYLARALAAREVFSLLIWTLPTFLAERI